MRGSKGLLQLKWLCHLFLIYTPVPDRKSCNYFDGISPCLAVFKEKPISIPLEWNIRLSQETAGKAKGHPGIDREVPGAVFWGVDTG